MSKTIHFNDRTKTINIGANVTSLGEDIFFKIGEYEVSVISDSGSESIEIVIDREPHEGKAKPEDA